MSDGGGARDTRAIEMELEIGAPVDAVWKALTDPGELARWFPLRAEVEPGAGGRMRIAWSDDHVWEEEIRVWEPNRRLRTVLTRSYFTEERGAGGSDAGAPAAVGADPGEEPGIELATDYHLAGRGGATVLRLVHSGFRRDADWDEEFHGTRRGWSFELRGLRHYLERHRGSDRLPAWTRLAITEPLDEAWARLFGPDGLGAGDPLGSPAEGDAYALRTAGGDALSGEVLVYGPPLDFSATVREWNDGVLRVALHEYFGQREVNLWLSTYDVPRGRVADFEARGERMLRALFPAAEALPHTPARG